MVIPKAFGRRDGEFVEHCGRRDAQKKWEPTGLRDAPIKKNEFWVKHGWHYEVLRDELHVGL